MSQSRPQNSHQHDHEQEQISENYSSQVNEHNNPKRSNRPPGRPRGRGRPKLTQRAINRKKNQQQQIEDEPVKSKERITAAKEENTIEGYIRIVDFLKKMDCDQASFQNKMNPYHSLTATCFWYMVSAQYYSYDFFYKNNPNEAANHVLNRVGKLPIQMVTRFIKNTHQGAPLEFQTLQVKKQGQELSEHLNNLIPAPLSSNKVENTEKKLSLTTVSEDNQFIASNRAILFNFVKNKIQKSQKWASIMKGRLQSIQNLQPQQKTRRQPITFQQNKQQIIDASQLDILSRQVKKKKSQRRKSQRNSQQFVSNTLIDEEKEQSQGEQSGNFQNNKAQKMDLEEDSQAKKSHSDNKNRSQSQQIQGQKQEEQKKQEQQNQSVKKYVKQMTSDQVLLSSILNLPLDKVISILQSTIPKIELPQIYPTFMPIPKSDPLDFVFQLHEQEENYLEYLKQYQKKMYQRKIKKGDTSIQDQQRQTQFQDAKCQICTDGDYTDDNLIVFCSTCNISLHQRCVGLAKVPAESWVCDVCLAFGPAGINLPCPLCNVKGGAMKRTNIHIDSNLFKQSNPGYYQYAKKCPYNKQKQQYVPPPKMNNDQNLSENKEQKQQLYYDYFNKNSYPTTEQPVCHYVWVHYVCSIWVPQCYFEQKNGVINVKGIQNVEKKRYKHECFSCKKTRAGACVKCEDPECKKYFHPQCARKKKVYMQQLHLQKIKYLIFCEEHEPLKITRQIQYKKKKNRDQIIKFARMIEKYVQTYKIAYFPFKLMKIIPTKSFIQTFQCEQKQQQPEKKVQVIKQTDEDFIKQIILKLSKVKKITVTVIRTETGLKIQDIYQPSRRQMRKCLNKYDDFWHSIQNGQSAQENCKRYDRIIKQNMFLKDKMQIFLNGGSFGSKKVNSTPGSAKVKKVRTAGRKKKQQVQTLIQQQGGIFCICRKPYENQLDMIQCQICGQWYHYRCIGFIGTQVDAQTLQFHCMKCMKFQTQQQKRPRLQKCIHFFSSDSLYLNYSPPTPKLMSQQEQHEIKDDFKLDQQKVEINEQKKPQNPQLKDQITKQQAKQNKSQNITNKQKQESTSSKSVQAQISPTKDMKKGVAKSQKSSIPKTSEMIKLPQKPKNILANFLNINVEAQNGSEKTEKVNNGNMQMTITKFFNKKDSKQQKQKKQVMSGQIKKNGGNIKQKMAQLQRSVLQNEYNGVLKK